MTSPQGSKTRGIQTSGIQIAWILIFSILLSIGNEPAFSDPLILKFPSFDGLNIHYTKEAEQRFFDEILKQTQGKLRIESPDNCRMKRHEVLDSVRVGKVDLGHLNIVSYPRKLILNSAIYLFQRGPIRYENIMWVFDRIYRELPVLNNEILQFNQKIIYTYANLPTAVYFNKPINSFDEFKGKRILCPSRWALEILRGMGAVPITTSLGNLYEGLKSNAIEGVVSTYGLTYGNRFKQVVRQIIIARELWTPLPFHITVNLDTWNRFPIQIQKAIEDAAEASRKKMADDYVGWFNWVMAEHRKMGYRIVFADKKDIHLWTQQPEARLILNQWKAEAESAGFKHTTILLEKIQKIIHDGIEQDNM